MLKHDLIVFVPDDTDIDLAVDRVEHRLTVAGAFHPTVNGVRYFLANTGNGLEEAGLLVAVVNAVPVFCVGLIPSG